MKPIASAIFFGAAAALAGCGPTGPVMVPVSGQVTFDGKPLTQADITLFAADNAVSADGGQIKDGKCQFLAKPGPKRVEIVQTITNPDGSVLNGLPGKYGGQQSPLKMDVAATGPNEFNFELVSKK